MSTWLFGNNLCFPLRVQGTQRPLTVFPLLIGEAAPSFASLSKQSSKLLSVVVFQALMLEGRGIPQSDCSLLCIWTLADSVKNCLRERDIGSVPPGGGGWTGRTGSVLSGGTFSLPSEHKWVLSTPHPHTYAPQRLGGQS